MSAIADILCQPPYHLPTSVISIDDFYLPNAAQCRLAAALPNNPLVQHRGQPSTHDIPLALSVLSELRSRNEVKLPKYDKSAYGGQGDRLPIDSWETVNKAGMPKTRILILEGWCIGFRPLTKPELEEKWNEAVKRRESGNYSGRLGWNKLDDIKYVNESLMQYNALTDQLDGMIHLDAADPDFVYEWRLEQENHLRKVKGSGMTDDQVKSFVDGYFPAYELYTENLRSGTLRNGKGRQLLLLIGQDRKIKTATRL